VIRSYGYGLLPDAFNQTAGRKEAKRLTGKSSVPVLVLDDGTVIPDSHKIVEWARANPAGASTGAGASVPS
jgi:glutaredoxin 2